MLFRLIRQRRRNYYYQRWICPKRIDSEQKKSLQSHDIISFMKSDQYRTITALSEDEFVISRSRFITFAVPVTSEAEIDELLDEYRKRYNDSRHVCYAYVLGDKYEHYRANDDGEPSGSAGRPILGQIRSLELTNVLVMVVRYFGGIKLGTGGLVSAYQEGARNALEKANIVTKTIGLQVSFTFDYPATNDVNHVINDFNADKEAENYGVNCEMTLSVRANDYAGLIERLEKVDTLFITEKVEL